MALAVQANLVQLKVSEAKRRGFPADRHEIQVPSPGTIRRFRETLIDHRSLLTYSDFEIHVRLHEVWGQFCLFRWLHTSPAEESTPRGVDSAGFSPEGIHAPTRCESELAAKHVELHALLWRIRFEQSSRSSPESARNGASHAERIPARVFGKSVRDADDEELLLGACQHAGMLAAIRWTLDARRVWGEPGIMTVNDDPFEA